MSASLSELRHTVLSAGFAAECNVVREGKAPNSMITGTSVIRVPLCALVSRVSCVSRLPLCVFPVRVPVEFL